MRRRIATALHDVFVSPVFVVVISAAFLFSSGAAVEHMLEIRSLKESKQALGGRMDALLDTHRHALPTGVGLVQDVPVGHPTIQGAAEQQGCVVERLASGICPNASTRTAPIPELRLAEELRRAPFEVSEREEDVADVLAAALGWQNLRVSDGGVRSAGAKGEYRDGLLSGGYVDFAYPDVSVRYLKAKTRTPPLGTVIVLHGHVSSAYKTLGLGSEDYMRAIGHEFFDAGYNVIALKTTSDPFASAYVNSQLSLFGVQLYGLWARAVCAIAADVQSETDRLVLYGLSNGGMVAHFASILCDHFDLVIVDDILADWRRSLRAHPFIFGGQNYGIFFLAPLFQNVTVRDLVTNVRNTTVFTRAERIVEALASDISYVPVQLSFAPRDGEIAGEARAYLVEKRHEEHVAEVELVLSLLRGEDIPARRAS